MEAINRWQFLAAAVVIVVGINIGIYSFSHSPNRPPAPVEDTAPTTVSKTPPPSKTEYRP